MSCQSSLLCGMLMLMDPNQAPQTNQPFDPNQYDFITNPADAPKKSLMPKLGGSGGGGSSGKSHMLLMIVGALGILTVVLLLFGVVFRGGDSSKEQMLKVAREQSAIIAVTAIGMQKAGSTDTKSLANSVSLTLTSDQQSAVAQLAKNGTKVKDKDIAAVVDPEIAKKMTVAEQNGTFDVAFESALKDLLATYKNNVQSAYDSTDSKSAREVLTEAFDNTSLLIIDAENNK